MNKKRILCLAMTAVMAFAVSGSPESMAAKKSKKIKLNKSKITLTVGETYKLKLKNNKKKVKWSSSKKKVATVGKKGKVTAKKKGTAKITAKVDKKKYTCKVTVKNIEIASVNVLNSYTVSVKLSAKKALTKEDFALKIKAYNASKYIKDVKIRSVTTADKLTYNLALATSECIHKEEYVQVAIDKLAAKGLTTKETVYREITSNYTDTAVYELTQGKNADVTHLIGTLEGYAKLKSITGLPAGLIYEVYEYSNKVKFGGKPTTAGVFNGTIVSEDEFGNTYTDNITWLVGSEKVLAAACDKVEIIASNDTLRESIFAVGGSGSYLYEIIEKTIECTVSEAGSIVYTPNMPGTYQVKVKVTDAKDASLTTTAVCDIRVMAGRTVTGTIKDALGNPITAEEAVVYFENADVSNQDAISNKEVSITNAATYSTMLTDGTYDVYVRYNHSRSDVIRCTVNADKQGLDIVLPVYPVTLSCDNANINLGTTDWSNQIDKGYRANANILYLEEGTYNLVQTQIKDLKKYELTIAGTVTAGAGNAMKATVTEENYIPSIVFKDISYSNGETVYLTGRNYYKYVPKEDGYYLIKAAVENGINVSAVLYDSNGQKLQSDDNGGDILLSHQLNKNETYYIVIDAGNTDNIISTELTIEK